MKTCNYCKIKSNDLKDIVTYNPKVKMKNPYICEKCELMLERESNMRMGEFSKYIGYD
jgi:superfamily II helicase